MAAGMAPAGGAAGPPYAVWTAEPRLGATRRPAAMTRATGARAARSRRRFMITSYFMYLHVSRPGPAPAGTLISVPDSIVDYEVLEPWGEGTGRFVCRPPDRLGWPGPVLVTELAVDAEGWQQLCDQLIRLNSAAGAGVGHMGHRGHAAPRPLRSAAVPGDRRRPAGDRRPAGHVHPAAGGPGHPQQPGRADRGLPGRGPGRPPGPGPRRGRPPGRR